MTTNGFLRSPGSGRLSMIGGEQSAVKWTICPFSDYPTWHVILHDNVVKAPKRVSGRHTNLLQESAQTGTICESCTYTSPVTELTQDRDGDCLAGVG